MSPLYDTDNRFLYLNVPLGPNTLLLSGFSGSEGISELFHFELDLTATNRTPIAFEDLLGQRISFGINVLANDAGDQRDFNGICIRMSQGSRNQEFTRYRMTVVPQLWMLTQHVNSRIFQHMSVPDILKAVLTGIDADFQLQGTFEPRDYCVQYQESDFQFASRLMEEEGIFYFFKFEEESHTLVLGNTPSAHPDIDGDDKLIYEELAGGNREEERVSGWEKEQNLRSGKYTIWDYSFELPHKHLDAENTVIDTVVAGKVTHKLKVAGNENLEVYEYPGLYAQRFDGVDKSGGDQSSDLNKIFDDSKRTAGIRIRQGEQPMLTIQGQSNCRQLVAGHKFTLQRHFNADGLYVVVSLNHHAEEGDFRSGDDKVPNHYGNEFRCIPFALPYAPQRKTPRPFIRGCQTAVVCGPSGEEIFTDKYGRVKIQFQWDREGTYDANSSCWVRVGTSWAGKNWGNISIPRVGQEVIVDFVEGDPDQPIVTGSVYNADTMPPYSLPDNKTRSTWKSRSTPGGGPNDLNEIRFEDKKGSEQVYLQAQKDIDIRILNDRREEVGHDRNLTVKHDRIEEVDHDYQIMIKNNVVETIGQDYNQDVTGKSAQHVGGSLSIKVDGDTGLQFGGALASSVGSDCSLKAGGQIVLSATTGITLSVGGSHVTITPAGVVISGPTVLINSGGSPLSGVAPSIVPPLLAGAPMAPDKSVPGSDTTYQAQVSKLPPSVVTAMTTPSHDPKSDDNKKKTHWVEVYLEDENGKPAAGVAYQVTLPDGSLATGSLDEKGLARVDGIDPGQVQITFPSMDKDMWQPK